MAKDPFGTGAKTLADLIKERDAKFKALGEKPSKPALTFKTAESAPVQAPLTGAGVVTTPKATIDTTALSPKTTVKEAVKSLPSQAKDIFVTPQTKQIVPVAKAAAQTAGKFFYESPERTLEAQEYLNSLPGSQKAKDIGADLLKIPYISSISTKSLLEQKKKGGNLSALDKVNIFVQQGADVFAAAAPLVSGTAGATFKATGLDETVSKAYEDINKSASNALQAFGVSKEQADPLSEIASNSLQLIAGGLGAKYSASKGGGIKGTAGGAAISSAPDVLAVLATDMSNQDKAKVGAILLSFGLASDVLSGKKTLEKAKQEVVNQAETNKDVPYYTKVLENMGVSMTKPEAKSVKKSEPLDLDSAKRMLMRLGVKEESLATLPEKTTVLPNKIYGPLALKKKMSGKGKLLEAFDKDIEMSNAEKTLEGRMNEELGSLLSEKERASQLKKMEEDNKKKELSTIHNQFTDERGNRVYVKNKEALSDTKKTILNRKLTSPDGKVFYTNKGNILTTPRKIDEFVSENRKDTRDAANEARKALGFGKFKEDRDTAIRGAARKEERSLEDKNRYKGNKILENYYGRDNVPEDSIPVQSIVDETISTVADEVTPATVDETVITVRPEETQSMTTEPKPELDMTGEVTEKNLGAMKNVDKIVSQEVIGEPKFELSMLSKKLPSVMRNANSWLGLDQYLQAIRMPLANNKTATLGNYLIGLTKFGKRVSDDVYKNSGIQKELEGMTGRKYKNFVQQIDDAAYLGGKTPKGLEINSDEALRAAKLANTGDVKNIREGTPVTAKLDNLSDISKLGYIWSINKERPDIQAKYVPEDLRKLFEKIEKMATDNVYVPAGDFLKERGIIRGLSEDYTRDVMSQEAYEQMLKDFGKEAGDALVIVDPVSGSSKRYFKVTDYFNALNVMNQRGYDATQVSPNAIGSIMKEKGPEALDIYRNHDPVLKVLDYITNVGDAVRNKTFVDVMKMVGDAKDIAPYTKSLVSNVYGDVVEQMLNIRSSSGAIETGIQKLAKGGTTAALLGNLPAMTQNYVSALVSAPLISPSSVRYATQKIDNDANAILMEEGFIGQLETELKPGEFTDKVMSVTVGVPIENATKARIAAVRMKDFLNEKGISFDPSNINSIIKAYGDARDNGTITKEDRIAFKDEVNEDLKLIANSMAGAGSRIRILNKLGLTQLKTFSLSRIAQGLRNAEAAVEQAVDIATSKKGNIPEGQKDALKKVAIIFAVPFAAAHTLSNYYKSLTPEEERTEQTDDLAEKRAASHVSRFYFDPLQGGRSLLTTLGTSTVTIPAQVLGDVLLTTKLMMSDGLENKKGIIANEILSSFIKNVGALRTIDNATNLYNLVTTGEKKSLKDLIAEKTGTLSKDTLTPSGISKGYAIDTKKEATLKTLFGIDDEQVARNKIYNDIAEAQFLRDNQWIPEEVAPAFAWMARLKTDTLRGLSDGVTKYWSLVKESSGQSDPAENYVQAVKQHQYVKNVADRIDRADSFRDLLARMGVKEEMINELSILVQESEKERRKTMQSTNEDLEGTLGVDYFTKSIGGEYKQRVRDLEKKNPLMFNLFITGLARTKQYLDETGQTTLGNEDRENIRRFFNDRTGAADAAIAVTRGTDPFTTDISNKLRSSLLTFSNKVNQEGVAGIDAAKKEMAAIEEVVGAIIESSPFADGLIRSVSAELPAIKSQIDKMQDKGYKDFKKDFPGITYLLDIALSDSGEYVPRLEEQVTDENIDEEVFPGEAPPLPDTDTKTSSSSSSSNLTVPSTGTPTKPMKFSELVGPKIQQRPLLSQTSPSRSLTLKELLSRRS